MSEQMNKEQTKDANQETITELAEGQLDDVAGGIILQGLITSLTPAPLATEAASSSLIQKVRDTEEFPSDSESDGSVRST